MLPDPWQCVLLLIRSTWQFVSIGWTPTPTLRKASAKWLKRLFGLWIILREFQGLPFAVSLVSLRGQHFQSC